MKAIKSDKAMSKKKVVSFCEEEIKGDTAGRQVFQEKIEGRHPQLPPRVSPTLVTPLLSGDGDVKGEPV